MDDGEYESMGRRGFLCRCGRSYFCPQLQYVKIMRRSTWVLFRSACISGGALRAGLPGIGDLISTAWETTRPAIQGVMAADLQIIITLISFAVFLVATYYTWDIYIKGAKKGRKGLFVVLVGVLGGFVLVSLVIGSLDAMLSGSIAS
jgi:hypothetical protein